MALLVTEAVVLHTFDYLESSRIVRLVTRDAGMRSAIAKGARKSRRRFGSGLDLFAQGTAFLHTKPGRELDILSGFEDVRTRTELGSDLDRFAGAETLAEISLQFGRDGADEQLFDAIVAALDALVASSGDRAREVTLAGAWQIVAALGFGPSIGECAECGTALGEKASALFTHSAGGALCKRCAQLSPGGRTLPPIARAALAAWMSGDVRPLELTDTDARAHQRLLREFLSYQLHDGKTLCAFELWESESHLPRGIETAPPVATTVE
jgi:DNA repair protein RecO (recombination protein O)